MLPAGHKSLLAAVLFVALLSLSWASGDLAFFGSQQPSQSASSVVITAASAQGSVPSGPAILSLSTQSSSLLSASVEPSKVRPGDSMIISAQVSDPSGVSQVSADMGGIETVFFSYDTAMYDKGWWTYG